MRKRSLNREKICAASIALIESEGIEGLSMRKIAAKLNVEAASLYNHIANKSELFDLIQEHLYSQMTPLNTSKNWQDHLVELANCTRNGLLQLPSIAPLFAVRPTITDSSLAQAESTFSILINAGFKIADVAAIYRNLHVYILGHVLAEVGHIPGAKDSHDEPTLNKIDMNHYPTLKKAYRYKSNIDFDKGFKAGLENIISGLEILRRKKS